MSVVFIEITSLGSEEVICDSKKINIEFNSNEQGQFMKISEVQAIINEMGWDNVPKQLDDNEYDYSKICNR